MPYPTRVALGATTLARKWAMDVDINYGLGLPVWTGVFGFTEFTPTGTPGLQSDSDYDSGGYTSSTATTQEWGITGTFRRGTVALAPATYDPGQEYLRNRSRNLGPANTSHIRYYELNGVGGPQVEAYEGFAATQYTNNGGGPDALSTSGLTLTGQGVLLPISHPGIGTAYQTPVVASVIGGPALVAGGSLIIITGVGFAAATAVTIGGTTVTVANWEPVPGSEDTRMAIIAPPKSAGSYDIVVVNPAGTSASTAQSKLTYA